MATINFLTADESGLLTNGGMTATAVGGDVMPAVNDGSRYVVLFRNDHTSGVDVILNGQVSNQNIPGFGKMSKANTTKTVAANGGLCAFVLTANEVSSYLNGSSQIAFTYASHNVGLKVVGYKI